MTWFEAGEIKIIFLPELTAAMIKRKLSFQCNKFYVSEINRISLPGD